MPPRELRILQSSNMGYGGVTAEFVREGLKHKPDVIVGQGTSSDPGPGYFGADEIYGYVGKFNKKRDLTLILDAAKEAGIPFIISGGSPSGSDPQLEGVLRIVNEICRERGHEFKLAVISGEMDKDFVRAKMATGSKLRRIIETDRLPEYLSEVELKASKRIVAQMGPEPIIRALESGVDGVIVGRAVDVGLHMAYPMMQGYDTAIAAHMAKTIECGALCASPPADENVFAIVRDDHFLVWPLNPKLRCTVSSVAAHAFYERADITREMNPSGYLDITEARYEQFDERTVKASGAKWVEQPYSIKLEGVRPIGYRTISILGLRDPNLIAASNEFTDRVRGLAKAKFASLGDTFRIDYHIYGRNAVLGPLEPERDGPAHELCLVVSVIAETQALSTSICAYIRGQLLFGDYQGRTSTSGNVALLFSPGDIELGPVFVWNVWHGLELDDPCEPFPHRIVSFPNDTYVD